MGSWLDRLCPQWRRSYRRDLSQELLEEYRSNNTSEQNIVSVTQLRIRPSTFIRERYCLPNDCYENLGYIGEGSYGMILKVKPNMVNDERAMKIIKKTNVIYNMNEDDLFSEIKILKSLDHPNIIKIYEFFKDAINYYVVTEYYEEGDLYTKLTKMKFFDERVVSNIMKQVLSAVAYLHSKNIIHGDLKLDNILIDSSLYQGSTREKFFDIKLIDFGCSSFFARDKKYSGLIGTSYYIAPEVIQNEYNQLCDIWSCGVIMYILLCGKPPFFGSTEEEILENIKKGTFKFDHIPFKTISEDAKDLITWMLTYDSKNRASARQALSHPWFRNGAETLDLADISFSKTVLNNLKNFNAEQKFQQAVVTFITHNLVKKDEVNDLRRIFKYLDKNSQGRISKENLQSAFSDVFGTVLADIELASIMKSIDHDNNGFIEYEEFLRATIDRSLLLSESNLNSAFELFDINKDGKISSEEIKNIIGGGRTISDNVIVELLAEIDKQSHEEIKYDEFKTIMNKVVR